MERSTQEESLHEYPFKVDFEKQNYNKIFMIP